MQEPEKHFTQDASKHLVLASGTQRAAAPLPRSRFQAPIKHAHCSSGTAVDFPGPSKQCLALGCRAPEGDKARDVELGAGLRGGLYPTAFWARRRGGPCRSCRPGGPPGGLHNVLMLQAPHEAWPHPLLKLAHTARSRQALPPQLRPQGLPVADQLELRQGRGLQAADELALLPAQREPSRAEVFLQELLAPVAPMAGVEAERQGEQQTGDQVHPGARSKQEALLAHRAQVRILHVSEHAVLIGQASKPGRPDSLLQIKPAAACVHPAPPQLGSELPFVGSEWQLRRRSALQAPNQPCLTIRAWDAIREAACAQVALEIADAQCHPLCGGESQGLGHEQTVFKLLLRAIRREEVLPQLGSQHGGGGILLPDVRGRCTFQAANQFLLGSIVPESTCAEMILQLRRLHLLPIGHCEAQRLCHEQAAAEVLHGTANPEAPKLAHGLKLCPRFAFELRQSKDPIGLLLPPPPPLSQDGFGRLQGSCEVQVLCRPRWAAVPPVCPLPHVLPVRFAKLAQVPQPQVGLREAPELLGTGFERAEVARQRLHPLRGLGQEAHPQQVPKVRVLARGARRRAGLIRGALAVPPAVAPCCLRVPFGAELRSEPLEAGSLQGALNLRKAAVQRQGAVETALYEGALVPLQRQLVLQVPQEVHTAAGIVWQAGSVECPEHPLRALEVLQLGLLTDAPVEEPHVTRHAPAEAQELPDVLEDLLAAPGAGKVCKLLGEKVHDDVHTLVVVVPAELVLHADIELSGEFLQALEEVIRPEPDGQLRDLHGVRGAAVAAEDAPAADRAGGAVGVQLDAAVEAVVPGHQLWQFLAPDDALQCVHQIQGLVGRRLAGPAGADAAEAVDQDPGDSRQEELRLHDLTLLELCWKDGVILRAEDGASDGVELGVDVPGLRMHAALVEP
mmetsp:Transcript_14752/g.46419  ORF Transcript_14752/g.46419 Transcript_14752/m.46419 type:complete len:905 (+) Transcript_14752:66-2780(+)